MWIIVFPCNKEQYNLPFLLALVFLTPKNFVMPVNREEKTETKNNNNKKH